MLLALLATVGVLAWTLSPQAEELSQSETRPVRESELELYIAVYSAMQSDHSLIIDEAIRPHHISLDEFRDLERRIQKESQLVDRVRKALLDHAKQHSVFARSDATPTSGRTPAAQP